MHHVDLETLVLKEGSHSSWAKGACQAHRFEDDPEAVTFWEVVRSVLLALVLIGGLWAFMVLAAAVVG